VFAFCQTLTKVGLPPQFVYLNYPFPLLSVLEFGLPFTPVLHAFFSPIYLAASVRILGHLFGVFLHHFNPKVLRTSGEKGLVHTLLFLVVLGKDSTGFSPLLLAIFFFCCFFPSTHGFPLLLPLFSCLLHPISLYGFGHLCFSLTLFSSLTLKECACS